MFSSVKIYASRRSIVMANENIPNAFVPKRRVRSFVRRGGRATARQLNAIEQYWPQYGLNCTSDKFNFDEIFGRSVERILEIGFGMGESLLELASLNAEIDYIGVDVHNPGVGALIANANDREIRNLKVIKADCIDVLQQSIPAQSLSAVLIFFPDPWPKQKHHKRRLIQPKFIEMLAPVIKPGGIIHIATDWAPYASHILEVLTQAKHFDNTSSTGYCVERPETRPLTKYEQRGNRLGHDVFDILVQRNKLTVSL